MCRGHFSNHSTKQHLLGFSGNRLELVFMYILGHVIYISLRGGVVLGIKPWAWTWAW